MVAPLHQPAPPHNEFALIGCRSSPTNTLAVDQQTLLLLLPGQAARMGHSMANAADLSTRQQLAAAAASAAHLAPKETQEWAEGGWWKCQGQAAPAGLIPRE